MMRRTGTPPSRPNGTPPIDKAAIGGARRSMAELNAAPRVMPENEPTKIIESNIETHISNRIMRDKIPAFPGGRSTITLAACDISS